MNITETYTNPQGNTVTVRVDHGIHHVEVKTFGPDARFFANERKLNAQSRAAARKIMNRPVMVSSGGSVRPGEYASFTGVFVPEGGN